MSTKKRALALTPAAGMMLLVACTAQQEEIASIEVVPN